MLIVHQPSIHWPPRQHPCPTCGTCPTCGSRPVVAPWVVPVRPVQPIWVQPHRITYHQAAINRLAGA